MGWEENEKGVEIFHRGQCGGAVACLESWDEYKYICTMELKWER